MANNDYKKYIDLEPDQAYRFFDSTADGLKTKEIIDRQDKYGKNED